MKKLAVIKNQLFKDYVKIVATDNLEEMLDNPNVPVPFTCEFEVSVEKADELSEQLKLYLNHKKVSNKDFIIWDDEVEGHLNFLFNIIQLSTGSAVVGKPQVHAAKITEVIEKKELPNVVKETVSVPVVSSEKENKQEAKAAMDSIVADEDADDDEDAFATTENTTAPVVEVTESQTEQPNDEDVVLISSLNIPVNSTIEFSKKDSITAVLVDEKTVIYEDEAMPLIDATKKAFKKAGVTGLPLGLANWNYNGRSLKSFKE